MEQIWTVQRIVEEIDKDDLIIYIGNSVDMEAKVDKCTVLFSHELKRSGAPSVLLDMSKVLLELGYSVFLICEEEGELLGEFVEQGVNVILYRKMSKSPEWLIEVAKVFPEIWINSLALHYIACFLAPYSQRLFWWIHEAEITIESWIDKVKEIPMVPALKLVAASPLIQKSIRLFWDMEAELLNFYIEDVPKVQIPKKEKLNIINVGDVNGNKGQEILLKAFEMLDNETKKKCELYFCGDNQRFNEQLLLKVLDFVDANENVHMLEGMPKAELYEVYDEIDIVVVASYYESTSAVAVEGLMKEKLCICTETCGVCEYLKDGESVLTFKRGDEKTLSQALYKAINQYDSLTSIRETGRRIYEKVYTREVFKGVLEEILSETLQINPKMNC